MCQVLKILILYRNKNVLHDCPVPFASFTHHFQAYSLILATTYFPSVLPTDQFSLATQGHISYKISQTSSGRPPMTNQVFTETLLFTRCARYTTNTCSHRKNTAMKLAEINAPPKCFLLNDQTVEELNRLCSRCNHFQRK